MFADPGASSVSFIATTLLDASCHGHRATRRAGGRGLTAASRPRVAIALPAFPRRAASAAASDRRLAAASAARQWLASRGRRMATRRTTGARGCCAGGPGAACAEAYPAGVSARALAAGRREDGSWACADPVHLLTGLDHLRLAPLAGFGSDPRGGRWHSCGSLNAALVGTGFSLFHVGCGPWTLACGTAIECDAWNPRWPRPRHPRTSASRARRRTGPQADERDADDAARASGQRTRARDGLAGRQCVWLWGFGTALETAALDRCRCCARDDAWLRGLWRLHGADARPLDGRRRARSRTDDPHC